MSSRAIEKNAIWSQPLVVMSEFLRPHQRVEQVGEKDEGDEAADDRIKRHGVFPPRRSCPRGSGRSARTAASARRTRRCRRCREGRACSTPVGRQTAYGGYDALQRVKSAQ